jgi:uncharacterized protein YuzE
MAEVKIWYDQEGDFLEITFEDAAASMEEINDDVFERRTPDGRVVGFAVINFSKHDKDTLRVPLAVTVSTSA